VIDLAISEVRSLAYSIDRDEYRDYVEAMAAFMLNADAVIGVGAGRMGYSLRAFIMRLTHMGYPAFMIGDTGVPRVTASTVVIVSSSSGETPTNVLYAKQARQHGGVIFALTSDSKSKVAEIASYHLAYGKINSMQPMKTAYEQFTYLLFDAMVIDLIRIKGVDVEKMSRSHSVLE
jgi:6-phospho-3-hexuloisomerase